MKKILITALVATTLASTASAWVSNAPTINTSVRPDISAEDHVFTNTCAKYTYNIDWAKTNPCWNTWIRTTRIIAENWGYGKWWVKVDEAVIPNYDEAVIPNYVTIQEGFIDDFVN